MRFLNQTREYNRFSNNSWEIQLTKIVRCFKGNSIIWAEAHRLEWDCYETFERVIDKIKTTGVKLLQKRVDENNIDTRINWCRGAEYILSLIHI